MKDELKLELLMLIAGVIIGGGVYLVNASYLWNTNIAKEKLDISEGILMDITAMENNLISTDQIFLNNTNDKYIYIQRNPFYSNNGLYFSYQRDISKLDRQIANNTFSFYTHLLNAERYRNDIYTIQRGGDIKDLTISDLKQQQLLTQDTAREINISVGLIRILKQELSG